MEEIVSEDQNHHTYHTYHLSCQRGVIPLHAFSMIYIDSRYLKVHWTLWNTSRHPYLDISDLRSSMGDIMIWSVLTMWQFPELFLMFLPVTRHKKTSQIPDITLLPIFPSFRPMGMVGEACLPSNAYYPRTPDYTFYSGVHVCWSEYSDSSFVYGFMSLDYGLGTATTIYKIWKKNKSNNHNSQIYMLFDCWS